MLNSNYLSLLAAFGAVSALAHPSPVTGAGQPGGLPPLPVGLNPGIHHYSFEKDGTVKIKRIADLDPVKLSRAQSGTFEKRNTFDSCEDYSFTSDQASGREEAWNSLSNWAGSQGTGDSPWIYGHYFALTGSGVYAYLCEWGNGNYISQDQVGQARAAVDSVCHDSAGMHQWNEWQKGSGIAVTGRNWCNGQGASS